MDTVTIQQQHYQQQQQQQQQQPRAHQVQQKMDNLAVVPVNMDDQVRSIVSRKLLQKLLTHAFNRFFELFHLNNYILNLI